MRPAADGRTNRCTNSPQSCTCSRTSPAPVGGNPCGRTAHPLGGPGSRQAGSVYRKQSTPCNLHVKIRRPSASRACVAPRLHGRWARARLARPPTFGKFEQAPAPVRPSRRSEFIGSTYVLVFFRTCTALSTLDWSRQGTRYARWSTELLASVPEEGLPPCFRESFIAPRTSETNW